MPMTVAAGFKFDRGVLLCADSQISYGGVSKTQGQKVGAFRLSEAVQIGMAFAGSVSQAKVGLRDVMESARDCGSEAAADILTAMQSAHAASYQRVFRHPKYGQEDGPDYWLIFGLRTPNEGVTLYSTEEDSLTPVESHVCEGSGTYLFRYLVDSIYRPEMSIEKVGTLAAFALEEVKSYDPNVGFNSEFLVLTHEGMCSNIAGYDIGHVETFGREFKRNMYELLLMMADLRESDDAVERAKLRFQNNLTNLRANYLTDKQHRNSILKLLELLSQPGGKTIKLEFTRPSSPPLGSQK
jgi:20S proteasome alpha/beta subunit